MSGDTNDLWEVRIRRDQAWHLDSKPKRLKTGLQGIAASLAGSRLAFDAGDVHSSIGMLQFDPNVPKPFGQLERIPGMMNAKLWNTSPDGASVAYKMGLWILSSDLATGEDQHFSFPNRDFGPLSNQLSKVLFVAGSPAAL